MIDHVGIYGSRVAEGLSASNVGLVIIVQVVFIFITPDTHSVGINNSQRQWA